MKYSEQLKTKEWLKKRLIILERDKFCCTKCGSKSKLQVHHKKYISGRAAWDYPNSILTTLCSICHKKLHETEIVPIEKDFRVKKKKKSTIKKKLIKKKGFRESMSPQDRKIQLLYDERRKKLKGNRNK